MNNLIDIENLNFSFEENIQVLNNISISIGKGEYLAVLGASGSGKSTLLRMISHILPANVYQKKEGRISIFGLSPSNYLDTGKLSFMFQESNLMPNLNVRENISFPVKLRGQQVDDNFLNELIEIVGLTEHQLKFPKTLSGGMKTRVSLARAFMTKPELLLLDEPFSALDISWRYELYQYLELLALKFKTTVLLVTHDIQEAVLLGNKIIILSKKGEILDTIIPKDNNISDFGYESVNRVLKENTDILLDVQTKIIIDGERESSDLNKAHAFADFLIESIQNQNDIPDSALNKIQIFRKSIDNRELYDKLLEAWYKSSNWNLKQELLWRILDSKFADEKIHESVYKFITSNWSQFILKSQNQEYFRKENIQQEVQKRMESKQYPVEKNWLYLVYLLAATSDQNKLDSISSQFVRDYINVNPNLKYKDWVNSVLSLNHLSDEK